MDWLAAPELWTARWLFTRTLAAVFVLAFANALLQFRPLLGTHGLLPVPRYLARVSFRAQPSLFHLHYSDRFAMAVAGSGLALSVTLVVGLPQQGPEWGHVLVWLAVWVLYLSIVNVGQVWYGFGWESILLEAGFFAAFVGTDRVSPPRPAMLLVLWLLFRVELGAGLIKLRGDPCWRDLTCLEYHHETQPQPGPFSWYAHHLPRWWHRVEVGGNYVAQLAAPFLLFAPQPLATLAAAVIIVTQAWLVLTGNFAWLNVVTMVLATAALDGTWLAALPAPPAQLPAPPPWLAALVVAVALAAAVASRRPVRNMLARSQRMNERYNPLHLVGTYGAFGSVTRRRDEVVIEGTADPGPGPDSEWREYGFKGKPGDVGRRPPQIAPYHLRLDWLLWFVALSPVVHQRWMFELLRRLLEGDALVLRLLRHNPFPGAPPAAVRVVRYRYRFTTPAERRASGHWWVRQFARVDVPPAALSDGGELVAA